MTPIFNTLIQDTDRRIAIVGAGGKTSLMFLLAHGFRKQGLGVLTSTTTRILYPNPDQSERVVLLADPDPEGTIVRELQKYGHVTVAKHRIPPGDKLKGMSCSQLMRVFDQVGCEHLVIEADGARGLSLKAPGASEPVVPASVDVFICLVGMDIIGRTLDEKNVFRPELVANLTGLALGEPVTKEAVARLCVHPQGMLKGCPPAARSYIFFNKTDLPQGRHRAEQVMDAARRLSGKKPNFWVYGSVREDVCTLQGERYIRAVYACQA